MHGNNLPSYYLGTLFYFHLSRDLKCIFNARFVERKIWNSLAYVADRLKKLRGSEQPYLVNVKIVLM